MQSIANKVYMEDSFPGVTLGAISTPRGLIQIDAPPSPEDSRTWRASLMNLGAGPDRLLINLDSHPDRTLGARAMDCTIIAHEKTAHAFRNRPTTFKAQGDETGASWESIPGLGSVRWAPPEISFTQDMVLYWGEHPIHLHHRPGPTAGAIWVVLPADHIVFVGDLVLKNQPPFLSNANLPQWIDSLKALMGPDFKKYAIVSGRGGVVTAATIKSQLDAIKHLHDRMEKLSARNAAPEATERLVDGLLSGYKVPAARQKNFTQRLRYGLRHYYIRHYHPSNGADDE
ncbi:MAG: MBL fold metallo-hydrolase [Anaerolineaceae bacterium]|nr:MAG: MBL fold metallo-hydrolase [Anaerolineaceae bacterium]